MKCIKPIKYILFYTLKNYFCYVADGFYMTNPGTNCPVGKVVSTLEDCRVAAAQFGLAYYSNSIFYYNTTI